ncbi:hypothetical protein [Sphingobacterium faecale]|uniref:Uncharacterized protein n=1 Tax=Sphingobacterium faecale TaxID=2803775 RepID=A0ABS1R8G6_9SPHI|nr:hypothetical protein [Sphingobacterium faecale]MBL1411021.1 hypothetical protein [Sphingobacterium faecale]
MWHLIIALFMAGSFSMQLTTQVKQPIEGNIIVKGERPKGGDKGDIRPPIPKPKGLRYTA